MTNNNNQAKENNPLAIVSLVLGLLSWFFLPLLGAIGAIICGHIAKSQIKREHQRYTGGSMATAGLITGYLNVLLFVGVLGFIILMAIMAPVMVQAKNRAHEVKAKEEINEILIHEK